MNEPIDKIFTINSQQMEQESKRVVGAILGIDKASEQLTKTLLGQVDAQKNIISQLEKELGKLEMRLFTQRPGFESNDLKAQMQETVQLLEEEKKTLVSLESHMNLTTDSISRLTNVKEVLTAKMQQMQQAGEEETEQFREIAKQAEAVGIAIHGMGQKMAEKEKTEKESLKTLLDQYKIYADQRTAIEEKYDKDINRLKKEREKAEKSGDTKEAAKIDGAINVATMKKGQDLITHDFNMLKEDAEYVRAFENLKNASTETLTALLDRLSEIKQSSTEVLEPSKLKEYSASIQQIIDELGTRNPLKTLASAQNELTQSNERLAKAKTALDEARKSGNEKDIAKAETEHREALDGVEKANNNVAKTQETVNQKMSEFYKAITGVGEAIGGKEGQIISLIGNIGGFIATTISGIQKAGQAGAGALAAVEKASAILAIIQVALQLMSKMDGLIADNHKKYEKFAKKEAEINKLRDAVNEYELAVLKARQAEDSWFAENNLKSLKDAKEVNKQVKENYDEKINEQQATYVNESGGGWFTKWAKEGFLSTALLAAGSIGGAFGAYKGLSSINKYDEGKSRAIDNLRIETRSSKKGFLGSGIGGKSQKTEDLRTWARNNGFGDLFDSDDMINKDAAQAILDKYGDKLVGETKETLEALVEMKNKYDEYKTKLQDFVKKLYEPIVKNFTESLWDWFDNGKDALDSFKEKASATFRDIVTDMMRTIVLEKVVGSYSDDIAAMYNEYAEGTLSEKELMDQVAERTNQMIDIYDQQLPTLQGLMTTLSTSLSDVGIDIQKKQEEKSQTAEKGAFQTMSQETGSLLEGQFTAIRIHTSNIYGLMVGMEKEGKLINNSLTAIEKNTYNTVGELKEVNNKLKQIKVEGIKVL